MTTSAKTRIFGKNILEKFFQMDSVTFGELIRKRRIELKKALREVAAAVSIDQSILSKIERNRFLAPAHIIPSLASFLELDYSELQIKYLSEKIYQDIKEADYGKEAIEVVLKRIEQEKTGTRFEKDKTELIDNIKEYFKKKPIEKVWVFGSFARDEESRDSDLDLLVRFKKPNEIDLFEYVGIRQDLEDLTGRQIDLVEEGHELDTIKPIIAKEKKLIYERKAV